VFVIREIHMAPKQKQPHGPPMTLGNMRHLGVHGLAM
jgi:hypothetical protein